MCRRVSLSGAVGGTQLHRVRMGQTAEVDSDEDLSRVPAVHGAVHDLARAAGGPCRPAQAKPHAVAQLLAPAVFRATAGGSGVLPGAQRRARTRSLESEETDLDMAGVARGVGV